MMGNDQVRRGRMAFQRWDLTLTGEPPARTRDKVTETQWLVLVRTVAEMQGWRTYHFRDSRRDVGGGRLVGDGGAADWPDLTLLGAGRSVFMELKGSHRFSVTAGQVETIEALRQADHEAFFVFPWEADAVVSLLRERPV